MPERNERVLHTRVPDSLERHIKRRARSLGMSASTVVRNVLLTTFGLVEDILNDSGDIALAVTGHEAAGRRRRARRGGDGPAGDVLAWQKAILNRNAVCDHCNGILPKGTQAAIGIGDEPAPRRIVCHTCLAAIVPAAAAAPKIGR